MKNNVFDFKTNDLKVQTKHVNKKKIVILIISLLVISSIAGVLITYSINEKFRSFWDYTILRKEVESTEVKSISLEKDSLKFLYAFDKGLTMLEKNILKIYEQDGNEKQKIGINITNPLYSEYNRFLAIAEDGGNKIYLLNEDNILWQKDLEGEISRVYVNKNGYVCVAMSSLGYKTVIILYTPSGEELFKTYLPTTYCIDMEISNDNKYIALAEASSSGTMLETSIKIVSIENAKTKPQDAFIAVHNVNSNNIILNLKYLDNGKLIVMYDNAVFYVDDTMSKILDVNDDTIFVDIEGNNNVISIEKQPAGILKTNYVLKIYNLLLDKTIEYNLKDLPKELYVKKDVIVVNYGTDAEIISGNSGWLIKKYISNQDIKKVFISNNFVSIEYIDSIKFIKI